MYGPTLRLVPFIWLATGTGRRHLRLPILRSPRQRMWQRSKKGTERNTHLGDLGVAATEHTTWAVTDVWL